MELTVEEKYKALKLLPDDIFKVWEDAEVVDVIRVGTKIQPEDYDE